MRRLLVAHRTVMPQRAGDYEMAWRKLHAAVTAAGAHAWRFRHASDAGRYMEFVEWKGEFDPTTSDEGRAALHLLDQLGRSSTDVWIESEAPT